MQGNFDEFHKISQDMFLFWEKSRSFMRKHRESIAQYTLWYCQNHRIGRRRETEAVAVERVWLWLATMCYLRVAAIPQKPSSPPGSLRMICCGPSPLTSRMSYTSWRRIGRRKHAPTQAVQL